MLAVRVTRPDNPRYMRFLRVFGKFLISVGVGVLMFVAWTLWGTGIYTQQQQDELDRVFDAQVPVRVDQGDTDLTVKVPGSFAPGPSEAVFRLDIPKIDARYVVVEGVGTEDLKRGPGHYPSCRDGFARPLCTEFEEMWPGENGRVIVSGHRTTYGAPFFNVDKLVPGDQIIAETRWGTFTYEVSEKRIVQPDSLAIAVQSDVPEIVLTTCNPKYSAAQRLIVFATLVEGEPA